ncbi:MAG TPA: L,D-transpeptidase [Acidimicrobiales bacterium]
MPRRNGLAALVAAFVLVALPALGGCAGGDDDDDVATPDAPADESSDAETTASSETTTTTAPEAEPDDLTSLVAQARGAMIDVWDTPVEAGQPARTLRADDEPSGHVVLLVRQELGPTWLEVYLPIDPVGTTGWIRRDDATLSRHRFRIEVSRSAHTLTVYAGEVSALETPVAIGPDAPEPADGLYIKDLIETPDPSGPYGRYAYGLSGSTAQAEDFAAGSGVVAIHGTDDESTLGRDADRGALAIAADDLDRLVGSIGLPLGTPVEILP